MKILVVIGFRLGDLKVLVAFGLDAWVGEECPHGPLGNVFGNVELLPYPCECW